jgi:spore coat polysaccharide biosynthesis protein SpsF
MSDVVTIVQARSGSTRLSGKVLLPLGSRTVLDVMLDRVRASRLAGTIVVATTTDVADDGIEDVAARHAVDCYRGHPTDLLDRHYQAARLHAARHVVKIPSDCPLVDPDVIDAVLSVHLAARDELDFSSNLHPPSHPDGNDVEVLRFDVLETAWHEATRGFEREHTTPFIWNRPARFRIANIVWGSRDCSQSHRVVLDYVEDYEVIRRVHDALGARSRMYSVNEIVSYLDAHPDVLALNAMHRGVSWYRDHLDELPALRRHFPIRLDRAS